MDIATEKASSRAVRIGAAVARYRSIELKYPPQQELVGEMDELLQVGLHSRGEPQELLVVLEPTFAGKSSAAKRFRRNVQQRLPEGSTDVPVAFATASASCTSRALVVALLRSIGVRFAPGMTEDAMWELWPAACRRMGVQIAIVDEIQHAHDHKFTRGVTNTIKNQLGANIPIVVLGTRSANELFSSNLELCTRTYDTVSLRRMTWGEPADEEIWSRFCKDLDVAMEKALIVDSTAGLAGFAEPLCHASLGRIGLLKKIVQTALRLALRRRAERISEADLATAVDVWTIRHRFLKANPFRAEATGE